MTCDFPGQEGGRAILNHSGGLPLVPHDILALLPAGLSQASCVDSTRPRPEEGGCVRGQGPADRTCRTTRPRMCPGPGLGGGPDGQWVGLGVEHEGVQAEQVRVVGEQQVQVLERLPQEEALHLVPGLWVVRVLHVADGGVATRGHLPRAGPCVRQQQGPGQRLRGTARDWPPWRSGRLLQRPWAMPAALT